MRGHVDVIEALLEKGSYPDRTDSDGNTCLHWAAGNGKVSALPLLLNACEDKAQALCLQNNQGDTVLHSAARMNAFEVTQFLLEKGAPVNQTNAVSEKLID